MLKYRFKAHIIIVLGVFRKICMNTHTPFAVWFDSVTMICISVINVTDRPREVIMRPGTWNAVSNPLTGGKEDGMKRKGKFFILFLLALLALTVCGGLGKEPKSGSGENEPGEEQAVYIIQETAVPDPDLALANLREADGRIWEQDYQLKGGKLYRLVQLEVKAEDSGEAQTQVYMQVLDPARGAWENYRIPVSHWDETEEYEVYLPQEIIAVEEDRVYLKVLYWDETYRLGVWSEDGSGGLLCVLPEELKDMRLVIGDGKAVGAYKRNQDSILLLDGGTKELQVKDRVKVSGQVMDVLCNPQSGELYWYGYDEERRTGVWRVEGNDPAARSLEGKGNASLAACSEEGVLYLADSQDLWRCSEKEEPESLCHFFDLDYYIEVVHGMSIQEDAVFLLAGYEGKDHILQVTKAEGAVPEKQKIVLAVPRPLAGHLKQAVAQFNRRNREYRVEAIEPEEGESGSDFLDRIQREMLAGGTGPDLFFGLSEKAEDFVENGYLQEVWDFLPEEGVLWQAALEDGIIRGGQYGVPYECRLRFATYSRELTGGRDSWTLEEMMKAVRDSGAEVLQADLGAVELVLYYGLNDKSSKSFIDWEKGESHLDEAPFLDFLAFAKEYADEGGYSGNPYTDPDTRLLEGKVAAVVSVFDVVCLDDLNELEARFQGQPAYIGYPRAEGNGIYVLSWSFYVSSMTGQREGCRAFLEFMLSEEVQKDYVDYRDSQSFGRSVELPTRLDAMEYYIEKKRQEKLPEVPSGITQEGIRYNCEGLSEEQEAAFRFLLKNALPERRSGTEIGGMVYEELEPYFAGQKTAEEAAKMLDNRMQLYLDERK